MPYTITSIPCFPRVCVPPPLPFPDSGKAGGPREVVVDFLCFESGVVSGNGAASVASGLVAATAAAGERGGGVREGRWSVDRLKLRGYCDIRFFDFQSLRHVCIGNFDVSIFFVFPSRGSRRKEKTTHTPKKSHKENQSSGIGLPNVNEKRFFLLVLL